MFICDNKCDSTHPVITKETQGHDPQHPDGNGNNNDGDLKKLENKDINKTENNFSNNMTFIEDLKIFLQHCEIFRLEKQRRKASWMTSSGL